MMTIAMAAATVMETAMATTTTMAVAMVKETAFVTATVTVTVVAATTTAMTTTSSGEGAEAGAALSIHVRAWRGVVGFFRKVSESVRADVDRTCQRLDAVGTRRLRLAWTHSGAAQYGDNHGLVFVWKPCLDTSCPTLQELAVFSSLNNQNPLALQQILN